METVPSQPKFDIQNAPFGYAYHKIITDSRGVPVDYEFMEINREFERITGLRAKDIIGRTVTVVLPGISSDAFDWIAFYGGIAIHGREGSVEQYSGALNRWYKVKAYSPGKYHFVTLFSDITGERILADSARYHLQDNRETVDYHKLCNDICTIAGARYVSFNLFDDNGMDFTTVAIAGISRHLQSAAEMMGFEIVGKKWTHDPERAEKIRGKNIVRFSKLQELTGTVLPGMLIATLERTFGIGEVYLVKIVNNDIMLGDFTVILPAGSSLQNETAVELYAQQAGLVIQKNRLRDRLRVEEAQLRAMTESAKDVIFMINPQGDITFCNPAAQRVFGYAAKELLGCNLHDLLVPRKYHEAHKKAWTVFRATGQGDAIGQTLELEGLRKDGAEIPVELSLSSFELGDGWYAVGIIRDISERKAAERELRNSNRELEEATALANTLAAQAEMASIAKSEFLANMSHEIRTPLNGIIGMTELLLDTELSAEQRHFEEIVRTSGETLLTLINDILDFSKIEAKKLELEYIDFDLCTLLEDFTASMAPRAQEKGLELTCAIHTAVPVMLHGDPGRLRQILANLTGNAIKFTAKGDVAISVEPVSGGSPAVVSHADRVLLRFRVRDTGIGIPADKTGLLFNKFTQIDASTTRQYGGTGLGLAISRQLVEMMGGEISLASVEGEGTEFRFTVGFRKQPVETPPHTFLPENLDRRRILVVDDNATNRELLATRMAGWGMRVCAAVGGAAALTLLKRAVEENDPFEIAVIDMQMPEMDGETLGRTIRTDDRLSSLRMVLLTSMGRRGDGKHFSEAGFDAYLNKPVRQGELKDVLALTLAGHTGNASGVRRFITRHTVSESVKRFIGSKAKILLAEDNLTNQQVALAILRKLGLEADVAGNGIKVLNALERGGYDLVLMDVQMPEMNGFEATRRIRDPLSRVRNHAVPIIAMTAHALKGDRELCLEAGMNGYVSKPVSALALADEIAKWLPRNERGGSDLPESPAASGENVTEQTVWDRAAMMETMMDDTDLAVTTVRIFLDDTPKQITLLGILLEKGDLPGVVQNAHAVKGAAATVGGEQLRSIASLIEKQAGTGGVNGLKESMGALVDAFKVLEQQMTVFLNNKVEK